jgi:hypothetical protein
MRQIFKFLHLLYLFLNILLFKFSTASVHIESGGFCELLYQVCTKTQKQTISSVNSSNGRISRQILVSLARGTSTRLLPYYCARTVNATIRSIRDCSSFCGSLGSSYFPALQYYASSSWSKKNEQRKRWSIVYGGQVFP